MKELISIIVPVYNVSKYLKDCVESILAQTYSNIEIILVDDGSTDDSGELCDKYQLIDSRIRVIHKENGGVSSAKNAGLDIAKGEFISFIDSDDSIHKDFLCTLYKMATDSNSDIAQCDFLSTAMDSVKLEPQVNEKIVIYNSRDAIRRCFEGFEAVKFVVNWNKLYRKRLFDTVRFPNGRIHEDNFVAYKLCWIANQVVTTNKYLYWYLQRNDSITGREYNINRLDVLVATKEALEYFEKEGMYEEYSMILKKYHGYLWNHYNLVKEKLDDNKRILVALETEARRVQELIISMPETDLLENIKTIYNYMSKEEQIKYKNLYEERIGVEKKEEYHFPTKRVKKGSRLAIYGAGCVGMSYVKELEETGYAKVEVWVDNLWKGYTNQGYDVKPIDALFRTEYDYVVIAVRNENVEGEIKDNIVNWGLDEKKIIVREK